MAAKNARVVESPIPRLSNGEPDYVQIRLRTALGQKKLEQQSSAASKMSNSGKGSRQARTPYELAERAKEIQRTRAKNGTILSDIEATKLAYDEAGVPIR